MSNPFKADLERSETLKRIRDFLDSSNGEATLRLEGPTGVGKTRLALEESRIPGTNHAPSTLIMPITQKCSHF